MVLKSHGYGGSELGSEGPIYIPEILTSLLSTDSAQ